MPYGLRPGTPCSPAKSDMDQICRHCWIGEDFTLETAVEHVTGRACKRTVVEGLAGILLPVLNQLRESRGLCEVCTRDTFY